MIVFICPDPDAEAEADGLLQRVRAIDNSFESIPRVVLSLSFTGNLRKRIIRRSDHLTVEYLNVFLHWRRISGLALQASATYVHTCKHAMRVFPLYMRENRIITDLHGVVPEELSMAGKRFLSFRYRLIEHLVVKRSKALIFVSHSMKNHFQLKYANLCREHFIIPIFSALSGTVGVDRERGLTIYAGGTQVWQCIDQMMGACREASAWNKFAFLTGNTEEMEGYCRSYGIEATVDSVPHRELPRWYARASFGFVLREGNIVNRVACPTKLVEYLRCGIIPIVKFSEIGDFLHFGYRYVTVEDFVRGRVPNDDALESAREYNRGVIAEIYNESRSELKRLIAMANNDEFRNSNRPH